MIRGPHACPGPDDEDDLNALCREDASEAEVIAALNSPRLAFSFDESYAALDEELLGILNDANGASESPFTTSAETDAEFLSRVAVLAFQDQDRPLETSQELVKNAIQAYLENHPATHRTPDHYRCFENKYFSDPKITEFKVTRVTEPGMPSFQVAAVLSTLKQYREKTQPQRDKAFTGLTPLISTNVAVRQFTWNEKQELLKDIPPHTDLAEWKEFIDSFGTVVPPTPEEEEMGAQLQDILLQEEEERAVQVEEALKRSEELARVNSEARYADGRLIAHVHETVEGTIEFDPKALNWNMLAKAQTGEEAFNLFCALTGYAAAPNDDEDDEA